MKVETIVGILSATAAIVLYSLGTWGAFRAKVMRRKDVYYLIGGVIFDVIATGAMWVAAGSKFQSDAHTYVALTAFVLFAIAAILGLYAVGWNKERFASSLSKWTLAPWALWAAVYVWGFFIKH